MKNFPGGRNLHKKLKKAQSEAATLLSSSITVAEKEYGVIYRLWVDVDVDSEATLEALPAILGISVTIGSTIFNVNVHPSVAHDDETNYFHDVDLGPWFFDFGEDGLYSGVEGDDIVVAVASAGTGNKTKVNYLYSGD